jgi:hypothetical protein
MKKIMLILLVLFAISCKKKKIEEPVKPVDNTSCVQCHEDFYYNKVEVETCRNCHHKQIEKKGVCRYF